MNTYVLNDTEVKLTGRVAHKTNQTTRRGGTSTEIKVEVTPIDQDTGTWKKWVVRDELYTITEHVDAAPTELIDADDAYREDEREDANNRYGNSGDNIIEGIRAIRQQRDREDNE